jgi:ClpP class serine protease
MLQTRRMRPLVVRALSSGHRPLAASETERRMRMLQPLLDQHAMTAAEGKTKTKASLAAAAAVGLLGSGAGLLGYAHYEILVNPTTIGATLCLLGSAAAVHGFNLFRHKSSASAAAANSSKSEYNFKLLNPTTRYAGAAQSLDKLCGETKFPEEIEKLLDAARTRDAAARKVKLDSSAAALLADVQSLGVASELEPLSASDLVRKLTPRLFVVSYVDPPVRAAASRSSPSIKSSAERFGDEVDLILSCAHGSADQVLINLTSPGGRVSEFGLAASHLLRLKTAGLRTTVAVDTVAASGGYMMAVCADHICAAPFAFVGSIGVVAELPNVSRLLKRSDVEWLLFTAGKFKRTVTVFGENSPEAKAKFQQDLDRIQDAFKAHVGGNRTGQLDIDEVATGEAWLALQAKDLGLVDELCTSHDVILRKAAEGFDVVQVSLRPQQRSLSSLFDRLAETAASAGDGLSGLLAQIGRLGLGGQVSAIEKLDDVASLSATSCAARANAR